MRRRDPRNAVPPRALALVAVLATAAAAATTGCDGGKTIYIGSDTTLAACRTPGPPPAGLFPPFYTKYLDANGIPILSSDEPDDRALVMACEIVVHMVSAREDLRQALIALDMRVGVIARDEVTTDLPDYSDLYTFFPPPPDWDSLRGVGATIMRPMSSFGEENMLCEQMDPYRGENVLVQTFASAVLLAMERLDATFPRRVNDAYKSAGTNGLWQNTYARETSIAYYQAGVQTWFETSPNNFPATREDLRSYDPALAALVSETLPEATWRPRCP